MQTTPAAYLFDCLDDRAIRMPEATAIVGTNDRISYAQVADGVRSVAFAIARAVPPDGAVATLLPHSPWGLVGVLGAYASGRVCIAISTNDPPERIRAMLSDARPAMILDAGGEGHGTDLPRLSLDVARAADARHGWRPDAREGGTGVLVNFTSGSSGAPKAIAGDDTYVLYRARAVANALALAEGRALLTVATIATMSGVFMGISTFLTGARILISDLAREGAGTLLGLARAERADAASMFAPVMRMLANLPAAKPALANVKTIRLGAGGLAVADMPAIFAALPPDVAINHTFASTEAGEIAEWAFGAGTTFEDPSVPIGFPSPPHEFSFLDDAGNEVDAREGGELVVTSPVLAIGEWQGGKLVPGRLMPVEGRPGWRRFRTGDIVRVGADGLMRFGGRADRQIKINSVRVEPGEIEAAFRTFPGVVDALVAPVEIGGRASVEAFVAIPGSAHDSVVRPLRDHVAVLLPTAMRPARITIVGELPRLPSGKPDLAALRALSRGALKPGARSTETSLAPEGSR